MQNFVFFYEPFLPGLYFSKFCCNFPWNARNQNIILDSLVWQYIVSKLKVSVLRIVHPLSCSVWKFHRTEHLKNFSPSTTYSRAASNFYHALIKSWMAEMCVLVGITRVLAIVASLCRLCPNLKEKEKEGQAFDRLRSRCLSKRLPRFVILIFGALLCLVADAKVASILPTDTLEDGRRELVVSPTVSFAYTGAVQTWYYLWLFSI